MIDSHPADEVKKVPATIGEAAAAPAVIATPPILDRPFQWTPALGPEVWDGRFLG